ncbi:MAG: hypothetical protein C4292_03025 [Nitrososphaera sp.]
MDLAVSALEDVLMYKGAHTVDDVVVAVAKFYHLDAEQLRGRDRSKEVAYARQIAMYLAKELTQKSLPEIGELFGGRDHTTVMHASKTIRSLRDSDTRVHQDWDKLIRILTS